jgi:hypothetical protein
MTSSTTKCTLKRFTCFRQPLAHSALIAKVFPHGRHCCNSAKKKCEPTGVAGIWDLAEFSPMTGALQDNLYQLLCFVNKS